MWQNIWQRDWNFHQKFFENYYYEIKEEDMGHAVHMGERRYVYKTAIWTPEGKILKYHLGDLHVNGISKDLDLHFHDNTLWTFAAIRDCVCTGDSRQANRVNLQTIVVFLLNCTNISDGFILNPTWPNTFKQYISPSFSTGHFLRGKWGQEHIPTHTATNDRAGNGSWGRDPLIQKH
jgi:hypothetical protein